MSKKEEGLRISQVPKEHWEKVFKNLVEQRGVFDAAMLVIEDTSLQKAFAWICTDEGHKFWSNIDENVVKQNVTKQQSHEVAIHAELSEILKKIEMSLR